MQYFYVGPYVECLTPDWMMKAPNEKLGLAWNDLLDDHKRLEWAMTGGNPITIKVKRTKLYQYCGIPIQNRKKAPRWPMLFKLGLPATNVLKWNDANPRAEIKWFKAAYDEELGLLKRIFTSPPTINWGLLYWYDI